MRFLILITMLAARPALADNAIADCGPLLASMASELRLGAQEAHDVQTLYNRNLSIPAETSHGLLEWLKIDPAKHGEIVLFSLNNFFGDSLIFHFSMLDFFLTKYPGKKIKIVSPKAGVLTRFSHPDVDWIQIPVRFAEYAKREDRDHHIQLLRERLPGFIKQNISPGAFMLYDLTTLDKAGAEVDPKGKTPELRPSYEFYRALNEAGVTAVGLSNLSEGYIFLGVSSIHVVAPIRSLPADLWALPDSIRLRTSSGKIVGVGLSKPVQFGSQNIYESWLQNLTVLFGPEAYLKWDSRYFVNASEDGALLTKFMSQSGVDPRKPYILINLNTLGRDKVRELTPIYSYTLKSVTTHILSKYADINVLAFFPENQFGPEVQEEILDFQSLHRGRMALIPGSMREIQPAFLNGAHRVISYDSGLAHLASFKPKESVLTVSTSSGQSNLWRRPGQNFVRLHPSDTPEELAVKIIDWVDGTENH